MAPPIGEPTGSPESLREYRRVLLPLALNALGFAFLETAVIPALPLIQKQLHANDPTSSALLESAYLAVAAVMSPLLGRWGDKKGKKGPLLVALGIYLVGAIAAGFSQSMAMLIPFRALQGAGGAVLALSIAILRDRAPEGRIVTGIGFLIGAFGVGIAAGFGLSDVVASGLGWRWLFWFGAGVVLANTLIVAWRVPASDANPETKVDVPGAGILGLSIAALIGATAFGQPVGWGSWEIILSFAAGVVLFAVWIRYELKRDQPLLDPRVLAGPKVLLPNLGALFSGFAAFSLFLLVPRFVHVPQGLPPAVAHTLGYGLGAGRSQLGLYLIPVGAGVFAGGPLGGWAGRRWSGKWPFVGGLAVLGLSALLLVLFQSTALEILAWMLLVGLGFGASVGASAAFVAQTVSPETVGVASAFNSLARLVGGGIGSEVASAIFSANLVHGKGGLSSAASRGACDAVFWIACGAALAGAVLASFVPTADEKPGSSREEARGRGTRAGARSEPRQA